MKKTIQIKRIGSGPNSKKTQKNDKIKLQKLPKRKRPQSLLERAVNNVLKTSLKDGIDYLLFEGLSPDIDTIVTQISGLPLPIKFLYKEVGQTLVDAIVEGAIESRMGQVLIATAHNLGSKISNVIKTGWDSISTQMFGDVYAPVELEEYLDLKDVDQFRSKIDVDVLESSESEPKEEPEVQEPTENIVGVGDEITVKLHQGETGEMITERDSEVESLKIEESVSEINSDIKVEKLVGKKRMNVDSKLNVTKNIALQLMDVIERKLNSENWEQVPLINNLNAVANSMGGLLRGALWDGVDGGNTSKIFETNAFMPVATLYYNTQELEWDFEAVTIMWRTITPNSSYGAPATLGADGQAFVNAMGQGQQYTISQPYRPNLYGYSGKMVNSLVQRAYLSSKNQRISTMSDVLLKLIYYLNMSVDNIIPGAEIGSYINGAHYKEQHVDHFWLDSDIPNVTADQISIKSCSIAAYVELLNGSIGHQFTNIYWDNSWKSRDVVIVPYRVGMAKSRSLIWWVLAHMVYPLYTSRVKCFVRNYDNVTHMDDAEIIPVVCQILINDSHKSILHLDHHEYHVLLVQVDAWENDSMTYPTVAGVIINSGIPDGVGVNIDGTAPGLSYNVVEVNEAIKWWYEFYNNKEGEAGALTCASMTMRLTTRKPKCTEHTHFDFFGLEEVSGSDQNTPIHILMYSNLCNLIFMDPIGHQLEDDENLHTQYHIGGTSDLDVILRACGIMDHVNKSDAKWFFDQPHMIIYNLHILQDLWAFLYDLTVENAGIPAATIWKGRLRTADITLNNQAAIINTFEMRLNDFIKRLSMNIFRSEYTKYDQGQPFAEDWTPFSRMPRYRLHDIANIWLVPETLYFTFKEERIGRTLSHTIYTLCGDDYYKWFKKFLPICWIGQGNSLPRDFAYVYKDGALSNVRVQLRYLLPRCYESYSKTELGAKSFDSNIPFIYGQTSKIPIGGGPVTWHQNSILGVEWRLSGGVPSVRYEKLAQKVYAIRERTRYEENTIAWITDPADLSFIETSGRGFL